MAGDETSLRLWLRRRPAPVRVRIRMPDGEERFVDMPKARRGRWQTIETAILTSGAEVVECLDGKGAIQRAMRIEEVEEQESRTSELQNELTRERRSRDATISAERRELALFAREYGQQLNEAFDRGRDAASASSDSLTHLVETLTQHLSMAIVNLHNVSVNLANIVQSQAQPDGEGGESGSTKMLQQVLQLAAMKAMSPAEAPPPNGKKGAK